MRLGRRCGDHLVDHDVLEPRIAGEAHADLRWLRRHAAPVQGIGRQARPQDNLVRTRRAGRDAERQVAAVRGGKGLLVEERKADEGAACQHEPATGDII